MPVRVHMDDTGHMVNRKTKTDKTKTDTNPIPDAVSSQNVPKPKRPQVYGQNVHRSVGQNVLKQNIPGADQSFFSIYGLWRDEMLIYVFIQFKSQSYLCLI